MKLNWTPASDKPISDQRILFKVKQYNSFIGEYFFVIFSGIYAKKLEVPVNVADNDFDFDYYDTDENDNDFLGEGWYELCLEQNYYYLVGDEVVEWVYLSEIE